PACTRPARMIDLGGTILQIWAMKTCLVLYPSLSYEGKRMAKAQNSGIAAILLLSIPLFCGCASKPPNYYVLHSLQSEAPGVRTARAENDLSIGVGPIKIPEYLERPQMAIRSTPNSL